MPRQIFSQEDVLRWAPAARVIRVVKRGGKVKIKLRTRKVLLTYVCGEAEANELLKKLEGLKKEIIEI